MQELNQLKLYTVREVCELLKISKTTAHREMQAGNLKFITMGHGRIRLTEASIIAYLNASNTCNSYDLSAAI